MSIPFIDFSEQYQTVKDEIDVGLKQVFEQGNFILGQPAKNFEQQFADYCGVKYGVGVNSGTDALYLALGAMGIGKGDEVILPTHTFIATALCISYTGAKPVFVDIESETYNINPQAFKDAITDKTRAVLPVHIYGQTASMDEINAIAGNHNIAVIEDAAQAHGATYKGRRSGSLGDAGCFSFYPTKSLGAFGDAGIVVTNDETVCEKLRMLRDYGRTGRYEHKIKGFNSRLDTVQAVVLSAKLKNLDHWNSMRVANAKIYNELLNDLDLITPFLKDDRTHVYQTYAVRVKNRDQVLKGLQDAGIGALIHYPIPCHLQEAYAELGFKKGDFPVAEKVANEIMSLPMFPHMERAQIEQVVETLKTLL